MFVPNNLGPDALLNIVGPNDILGEIHFMDEGGHSAEVAALENCELVRISHSALVTACEISPKLRIAMERLTTHRVRQLSRRQVWMTTAPANERLGRILLHFAERYAGSYGQLEAPISIPLRLSQSDLGALVGASRYRVHLCLHILQSQQLLRLEAHSRLTVLNPLGLRDWCDAQGRTVIIGS